MTEQEKEKFVLMQGKLQEIDGKVDEILSALKGDNFGQNKGLIEDFKDIKARLYKLENLRSKIIWTATGAGLVLGVLIDKLGAIFQKIIH